MAATVRQAFTLVELLVVGAIIVILVTLTLIVMGRVEVSAKITKTRTTIQKLDAAMQQIFEAYENELAVVESQVAQKYRDNSDISDDTKQKIAAHFVRDLMRMEIPQNWAEVYDSSETPDDGIYPKLGPIKINLDGMPDLSVEESPLLDYYWQAYKAATKRATGREPNRAALLFLIIQNLNPEALESFHASEVADTDGDGLLEFIDAWGNPIQFLRWAPAFPSSDVQQDVLKIAGYVPKVNMENNKTWWMEGGGNDLPDAMVRASANHVDPLDKRINNVHDAVGWFLYPLIYSAGPDGKYDILDANPVSPTVGVEGILDPFAFPYGIPGDDNDNDGILNHFDNIHNHQWYKSF